MDAAPVAPSERPQAIADRATRTRQPVPFRLILACAWIIGTLILFARIAWATLRLHRAVRRMASVDAPHVTELLASCSRELAIRRRVEILAADDLAAPALTGVLRPRLLLPRHVLENFEDAELRLILLHELGHLRRNDVLVNWIVSLLHALHWFNPVLWLAFARLRADRELATDELVLSHTGDDRERRAYGDTIVKLLQSLATTAHTRRTAMPAPLVGAVGILERAHLLRRRITMIAHFRSHHAKRWTLLAACCMLALAGLGLTDAVRGDDAKTAAPAPAAPAPAAGTVDPATFAAATAAASTRPGDEKLRAAIDAAVAKMLAKSTPPTAADIDAAMTELAQTIRKQKLVYDSQGQVANERQVNDQIAQARRHALELMNAPPTLTLVEGGTLALVGRGDASGVPAATATTLRKLGQNAPEIQFDSIPFADAIEFLRETTGLNFFVNWRALEAAGIDRNVPVSVRLKNVPYELALRYILLDAGGGSVKLEFAVLDGIVNIATAEELANDVEVRVYNVSRLLHNLPSTRPAAADAAAMAMEPQFDDKASRVIQIITETVAPDSWRDAGGDIGSIREINGRLVIAQTEANHALIARLLEEIDVADDEAASATK